MKHILIVDDDVHINQMLEEVLTSAGYKVTHAYSGTETFKWYMDFRAIRRTV